jgi:hypothetical protein
MEVKTEGLRAIVTIFANVSQFMESLAKLMESGELVRMTDDELAEVAKNINSISNFLKETGMSIHNMIEEAQSSETPQ